MNKTRRDALTWSLGAIVLCLSGVSSALTADGRWYLILGAIILLGAGVVCASRAILTARLLGDSNSRGNHPKDAK